MHHVVVVEEPKENAEYITEDLDCVTYGTLFLTRVLARGIMIYMGSRVYQVG